MPVEVELDIFSGRPNPKWSLEPRLEAELRQQINSLPPVPRGSAPEPPGLGYRGFLLSLGKDSPGARARIYGGAVEMGGEIRKDPSRKLEKWLLGTAVSVDSELLEFIRNELSAE